MTVIELAFALQVVEPLLARTRIGAFGFNARGVAYHRIVGFARARRVGVIAQQQKVQAVRFKRRHRLELMHQFACAFRTAEQRRYHHQRAQILRHVARQVYARQHSRL